MDKLVNKSLFLLERCWNKKKSHKIIKYDTSVKEKDRTKTNGRNRKGKGIHKITYIHKA